LDGLGGAVHNSGTMTAIGCSFLMNLAKGGAGATPQFNPPSSGTLGGSAAGGAINNLGVLNLQASTLASNTAAGGVGGAGYSGTLSSINGAAGAAGGSGKGGAICNWGTAHLVSCTIAFNTGPGAAGGKGGDGYYTSYIGGNGGAGGNGGDGCGGVFGGTLNLTNCTLAFNSGSPGLGGSGGQGGYGPHGFGQPGPNGSTGLAFGALGTSGPALANSLLATNSPANASGATSDLGHNLSSDGSCAFGPGSFNNTDPKLGPLANNGGPTLTMALLPSSPAIDAGDTSLSPATDQRGFPRPVGLVADIGAFEYGSVMPTLAISRSGATGLSILGSGNAGQPCRLLSSPDLSSWVPIATNQIGGDGTVLFYDTCAPSGTGRFYRVVMP
jgi:hypothetical protein